LSIGQIPIDPKLSSSVESSECSFVAQFTDSTLFPIFKSITDRVIEKSTPRQKAT